MEPKTMPTARMGVNKPGDVSNGQLGAASEWPARNVIVCVQRNAPDNQSAQRGSDLASGGCWVKSIQGDDFGDFTRPIISRPRQISSSIAP